MQAEFVLLCIFAYSDTQKMVSWDDSLVILHLYNNFTKHYCLHAISVLNENFRFIL